MTVPSPWIRRSPRPPSIARSRAARRLARGQSPREGESRRHSDPTSREELDAKAPLCRWPRRTIGATPRTGLANLNRVRNSRANRDGVVPLILMTGTRPASADRRFDQGGLDRVPFGPANRHRIDHRLRTPKVPADEGRDGDQLPRLSIPEITEHESATKVPPGRD